MIGQSIGVREAARGLTRLWLRVVGLALVAMILWAPAAATAGPPDLLPPVVRVISPLPDATVTAGRPEVTVAFSDESSGIDIATMRLALDHVDVTSTVEVKPTTLEVSPHTLVRANYTPPLPLNPGRHQVQFQVSDRAGNVATLTWSFLVETVPLWKGVDTGGASTLSMSLLPLAQVTENLDLHLKSKISPRLGDRATPLEVDARLEAVWASALVGLGEPLEGFSTSLENYAFSVRGENAGLAVGSVLVDFPSGVLLPQSAHDGAMLTWQAPEASGVTWGLTGFKGDSLSSQGFSLKLVEFTGVSGQLRLPNRTTVSSVVAASRERGSVARVHTIGVETPATPGTKLFLEGAHSQAGAGDAGYGLEAGVESRSKTSMVSLEWWGMDRNFKTALLLPELSGDGGVRRIRLKGSHIFSRPVVASVDMVSFQDNVEAPAGLGTAANNAQISLRFLPPGSFSYTAGFRLENRGGPASGPDRIESQALSGAIDYQGRVFGKTTSGYARYSLTRSQQAAYGGDTASLSLSQEYAFGGMTGVVEHTTKGPSQQSGWTDFLKTELSLRPRISFALLGLSPKLTGELTAGISWEERSQSRSVRKRLGSRLSTQLTDLDTLILVYEHLWAEQQDYHLKIEYRRNL